MRELARSTRRGLVAAAALELLACEPPIRFRDDVEAPPEDDATDATVRDAARRTDARGPDERIDARVFDARVPDAAPLDVRDDSSHDEAEPPDERPREAAADAPLPTLTYCSGMYALTNLAKPLETRPVSPWDGATVAGREIASRVRELRVGPVDAVWPFTIARTVFRAYARADDRWYDVTDVAEWTARTDARAYRVYFESPGRVARDEPPGGAGFTNDGATHTVTAAFAGQLASQRWNTTGSDFSAPLEVLGEAMMHSCESQRIGVLMYDRDGEHTEEREPADLRANLWFAVSDNSVVALDDTGLLVALRPGTAEVTVSSRYWRCGEETCARPAAIYPLTVTVLPY